MYNVLYVIGGYLVEFVDIYVFVCYFDCIQDYIMLIDKVYCIYLFGEECVFDVIEMMWIVYGLIYD